MIKTRTYDQTSQRCAILESFGLKILHEDSRVIHESFPEIEFDFSSIDLTSEKAARNIMWYIIQVTSSVSHSKGEDNLRKQFNNLLKGE
tara:strand:- start:56868 stop:57134 length:267 start_codon:yes stop_codon:yes gene_type:complete